MSEEEIDNLEEWEEDVLWAIYKSNCENSGVQPTISDFHIFLQER